AGPRRGEGKHSAVRRGHARPAARRAPPPLEHRILMTAALCLLAFGAVMVYSASSPSELLRSQGNGTAEFLRYIIFGAIGLAAMHVLERRGMLLLSRRAVTLLLLGSFGLLVLVLVPGIGVRINGARRWFAAGPIQFQPSELVKLALVLYVARYLAEQPAEALGRRPIGRNGTPSGRQAGTRSFRQVALPLVMVVGPACLLIVVEPDLGTALVIAFTITALLVVAGMPMRYLGMLAVVGVVAVALLVLARPYEVARLTSFLHPSATRAGHGYQAVQGQIALGSGGLVGVGLGRSVQKLFYLPEAQTDFILAVVGEELGVLGIFGVVILYGMIAYAGLRTARRAVSRYAKLLAAGLTSLILCQGLLNIFVVLGLAPLTGVPLPFISYAPTNLCVMLASIGLLLNIARPGGRALQAVKGRAVESSENRDRRRRDRRARRAGAGGR
ncbi:MAG: putative lipid II flippase FtsW, partial [Solirubrobacteraceae bacterium]